MPGLMRLHGATKHNGGIDAWIAAQPGELRALAERWFTRLRGCGPDVRELMHDGLATVCFVDLPFAYVGAFTAHVSVGFYHAVDLPDPAKLLEGQGKRMRHVKLRPGVALDAAALEALIAAAYRDISLRAMGAD